MPLLRDGSSAIRAAAVCALSDLGAESDVVSAAGDGSWRVRAAVARSLAKHCGSRAAAVAQGLLADPSLEVQEAVIEAVGDWPPRWCGPILLSAVEVGGPRTRKLAAERLAERWTPASHFPFAAAKHRRDESLRRLRLQFRQEYRPLDQREAVKTSFHADIEGGSSSSDAAVVLIDSLRAGDCSARRRGAAELAAMAAEKPLANMAVERLAAAVADENDQLVWQYALSAVAQNGGPTAARLACDALGHASPEVRRRGCEHLAAHPHPDNADALLSAVDDPSLPVAKAAVDALGRIGRPADAASGPWEH